MQRLLLIGVCLLCGNAMAAAQEKQTGAVEIPLDKVWAYNMPGTRDVRYVEGLTAKQWESIRRALSKVPAQGKEAGPGFAAAGARPDVLREVHAVLSDGKKPRQTFPADTDVTLVFFSYEFGAYVHLRTVVVHGEGGVVQIQYQFVPHKSKQTTQHIALIPLGKLRPGKVKVEIIQSPMEPKFVETGWKDINRDVASRIVCGSFSFDVK